MAFEFIREDLTEARYIRTVRDTIGRDATDVAESFFEQLLMLQQMKYENPAFAKKYAQETLKYGFDGVKPGATDLGNLGSILANPNKYPGVTSAGTVGFDELGFKRYLRNIVQGRTTPSVDRQFLLSQQKRLGISSSFLKSARRIAGDYTRATPQERQAMTARMINALRQDGKFKSDINRSYSKTVDKKGLTPDPKKKGIPGWAKLAGLAAAGYAVGSSNIIG